jgi:hypothetical protein
VENLQEVVIKVLREEKERNEKNSFGKSQLFILAKINFLLLIIYNII